jgi:thiol:disulfide interchange protein DsbA
MLNLSVAVAMLLLSGSTLAAVQLGKDYILLEPSQPVSGTQTEVQDFFYYGCPHCYKLHPLLVEWEETTPDVALTHVPVIFRDSMEPMARTFYALEALGQIRKLHDPLYTALHEQNLNLSQRAEILDFASSQGIDRAKFSAAYDSPSTENKVTRARQLSKTYRIVGTPTLIVNGKYVITGLTPTDTIRVLNEVMALVGHKGQLRSAGPAATPAASAARAPAPKPAPTPAPTPAAPAHVATSTSAATPSPTASGQELALPSKSTNRVNAAKARPIRSKSLDLRHCLELDSYAAIAKCAGEY